MSIKAFMLFILLSLSIFKTLNEIEHFIIQATFPANCGHSYLSKRNVFNSVKHALLTSTQCDCFKKNIDFYFGQSSKEIEIAETNEELGWDGEFNIFLFVGKVDENSYTKKLIGTSLISDSKHFYRYLNDGTDEETLLSGIINTVCSYCNSIACFDSV